jgi:hypothetical protein
LARSLASHLCSEVLIRFTCSRTVIQAALAFLCFAGMSLAASADEAPAQLFDRKGGYVYLFDGSGSYESVETTPSGSVFNKESGKLKTRGLVLGYATPSWHLELGHSLGEGRVPYFGLSQVGFPIVTQTDIQITSSYFFTGREVWRTGGHQLVLGPSYSKLSVDRRILRSPLNSPLSEFLEADFLGLGMRYSYRYALGSNTEFVLNAQWDFQRSISTRLNIETFGLYDPATLKPTSFNRMILGLRPTLQWRSGLYLGLDLSYEQFNPGSSPAVVLNIRGQPAALATYPGSRQQVLRKNLVLGWQF